MSNHLQLKGVTTNLEFLREVAADPRYAAGDTTTKFVEGIDYAPHAGQCAVISAKPVVQAGWHMRHACQQG